MLRKAGHGVRLVETRGPGSAGWMARREIENGADLILVAGGDGTVNEALPGLVSTPVPLAVLPAGTANVLSTELGFGNSMRRAARKLANLVPRRISVGVVHASGAAGPRHFLLMAGAGVDAAVVHRLNLDWKRRAGKLAYFAGGLRQAAGRFEEFEVCYDGQRRRVSFALISRVRKYGGDFEIARHVTLLDNHFEAVLLEGRGIFRYLPYLAAMLAGRLERCRGATVAQLTAVDLSVEPGIEAHIQVDGEYAGRLPARIELAPGALTLLAPPDYGVR